MGLDVMLWLNSSSAYAIFEATPASCILIVTSLPPCVCLFTSIGTHDYWAFLFRKSHNKNISKIEKQITIYFESRTNIYLSLRCLSALTSSILLVSKQRWQHMTCDIAVLTQSSHLVETLLEIDSLRFPLVSSKENPVAFSSIVFFFLVFSNVSMCCWCDVDGMHKINPKSIRTECG